MTTSSEASLNSTSSRQLTSIGLVCIPTIENIRPPETELLPPCPTLVEALVLLPPEGGMVGILGAGGGVCPPLPPVPKGPAPHRQSWMESVNPAAGCRVPNRSTASPLLVPLKLPVAC